MTILNKTRELTPPGKRPECIVAEDMLADALDGTLSEADQRWLDRHVASCAVCEQMLADARRGAAWLDMLKQIRPEPPADLFARIIAQTSGQESAPSLSVLPDLNPQPDAAPVLTWPAQPYDDSYAAPIGPTPIAIPANLLHVPLVQPGRLNTFSRMFVEPRLAMTAAMAFFSIALTLNLTGVRLNQVHVSDLNPSNLRHDFYEARAGAVRQYDSLRVVHVLESRVDDLRENNPGLDNTGPDRRDTLFRERQTSPAPALKTAKPDSDSPRIQRERNETTRGPVTSTIISRATPAASTPDYPSGASFTAAVSSDTMLYPGGY